MKVLLLQEILPPYRVGLFNEIAKNRDIDLYLYLLAKGTPDKLEWYNFKYEKFFNLKILKGIHISAPGSRFIHINYNLLIEVAKLKPDLICFGGFNLSSLQLILYAKILNVPTILWSESTKFTEFKISFMRKILRKFILKNVNSIISSGKLATEYLNMLNNSPIKQSIYLGYNAVDNDYYYNYIDKIKDKINIIKNKYGKYVILYVGRLLELKGVWELLKAYQQLYAKYTEISLILLGSGPLEEQLKLYCLKNNLSKVIFEGFVHQDKIVEYFAMADVFVLLSHYDCNPLVIFEALACSLPIVASYQVGNTPEFVLNDKNGYVVDEKNTAEVVRALENIINNPEKQRQFGEYSKKLSQKATYKKTASVFYQAIKETLNK